MRSDATDCSSSGGVFVWPDVDVSSGESKLARDMLCTGLARKPPRMGATGGLPFGQPPLPLARGSGRRGGRAVFTTAAGRAALGIVALGELVDDERVQREAQRAVAGDRMHLGSDRARASARIVCREEDGFAADALAAGPM